LIRAAGLDTAAAGDDPAPELDRRDPFPRGAGAV